MIEQLNRKKFDDVLSYFDRINERDKRQTNGLTDGQTDTGRRLVPTITT